MQHDRTRTYVDEARQHVTRALVLLDPADSQADDQTWTALSDAHHQLTVALSFINADATLNRKDTPAP